MSQQLPIAPVFEFKIMPLQDGRPIPVPDPEVGVTATEEQEEGRDEAILNEYAQSGWAIVGVVGGQEISDLKVCGYLDTTPPRLILARQIGFRVLELPGVIGVPGKLA